MYGYLYQESGKNYTIIHALDGYDEIALTGGAKRISEPAGGDAVSRRFWNRTAYC